MVASAGTKRPMPASSNVKRRRTYKKYAGPRLASTRAQPAAKRRRPPMRTQSRAPRRPKARRIPMNPFSYHDAKTWAGRGLINTPGAVGNAVCIDSMSRNSFPTKSTSVFLILQWTPTNMRLVKYDYSTRQIDTQFCSAHQLTTSPIAMSTRPSRLSMTVRNVTMANEVQGSVRVLSSSQALEWDFAATNNTNATGAFSSELEGILSSNPQAKVMSAHEFTHGKKFVSAVASMNTFKNYTQFSVPATTDFVEVKEALVQGAIQQPLNCIILEFVGMPANFNTYEVSVHSQDACRLPAYSLLAHLARPAPAGHDESAFAHRAQDMQRDPTYPQSDQHMGTPGGGGIG
jgi:hypothetical protein